MACWRVCCLILTAATTGIAAPVYAQQPPTETAAPPAAQAPPAATPPPGPSADTLKRAKAVGLHPEMRKGVTVYCWEDATIGTRFTTKKCVDEDQLVDMIHQREVQQDNLRKGRT